MANLASAAHESRADLCKGCVVPSVMNYVLAADRMYRTYQLYVYQARVQIVQLHREDEQWIAF